MVRLLKQHDIDKHAIFVSEYKCGLTKSSLYYINSKFLFHLPTFLHTYFGQKYKQKQHELK